MHVLPTFKSIFLFSNNHSDLKSLFSPQQEKGQDTPQFCCLLTKKAFQARYTGEGQDAKCAYD